MPRDVKKKPAGLKHLIERRARAAGDELRLRGLMKELGKELAAARRVVASCDTLIRDFNPKLDPKKIKPIRKVVKVFADQKVGLRETIIEIVQSRAPDPVQTMEIALTIARRFQLDFQTRDDLYRWEHNSVGKQLKRLVNEGLVERIVDHNPLVTWAGVRWRWKSVIGPSEARLLELIEAAGEQAHESDGDPG